jgi:hypothetical protein
LLRREIHRPLVEDDDIRLIDGVWRIDLPDRCVVCSKETVNDWTDDERRILDPYPLIAAPLVGVALGVILALWYWRLWLLPLPILAGVLVGYALRREERFALKLKRCRKHAENVQVPELTVWHRQLTLRPGHREVKLAFLRQPSEYLSVIPEAPAASSTASSPPETISLADDVPASSTIIHERPDARLPEERKSRDDGALL